MIPRNLFDRIRVVNAVLVPGPRGQQVRDWDGAHATREHPALVLPVTGSEDTDSRQTTIERWALTVLPDCPITADSRVLWRGLTLEVDGEAGLVSYRGQPYSKEARLKKVTDAA